jgi:hypothetical protein
MKNNLTFSKLAKSIRDLHNELTTQASRAVNVNLTLRNWLIGCYVAEYELNGADRATYGEALLEKLSIALTELNVSACGKRQLYNYLRFYQTYPQIVRSLTPQLQKALPGSISATVEKMRSVTALSDIDPETLLNRLSYTHIEQLLALDDDTKRTFYEIECIRGN